MMAVVPSLVFITDAAGQSARAVDDRRPLPDCEDPIDVRMSGPTSIMRSGVMPCVEEVAVSEVRYDYVKNGDAIYRESFAIIRREARLDHLPADIAEVVVRMIHAAAQPDLVDDLAYSPQVVAQARMALQGGAPILCDSQMVASGIIRSRLPAGNEVICMLSNPDVPALALRLGTTKAAAAVELWADRLAGAVVAIGNAPTALFHLLELVAGRALVPAAVIGIPVGFVGATEAKLALAANPLGLEYLTVHGRRGGSAIAASAINAIAGGAS